MPSLTQLFINGSYRVCHSGDRTTLINPASEEVFAEVGAADNQDLELAVASAHKAWEAGWRDMAPGKRAEILFNVAHRLRDGLDEVARLEMQQIGKPISDARDEV